MGIVYKYGPPAAIDWYLRAARLSFTSIATLNDVFESLANFESNYQQESANVFAHTLKEVIADPDSEFYGQRPEHVAHVMLLRGYLEPFHPRHTKRLAWQANAAMMAPVGVLSLSRDARNLLLWSHYGEGGKGFVVGFDSEASVFSDSEFIGQRGLKDVEYAAERPTLHEPDLDTRFQSMVFRKSEDWRYEDETRCVRRVPEGKERLLVHFERSTVRQIIIGPRMALMNALQIYELQKCLYPKATLLVASPNTSRYQMDLDPPPPIESFASFWNTKALPIRRLGDDPPTPPSDQLTAPFNPITSVPTLQVPLSTASKLVKTFRVQERPWTKKGV